MVAIAVHLRWSSIVLFPYLDDLLVRNQIRLDNLEKKKQQQKNKTKKKKKKKKKTNKKTKKKTKKKKKNKKKQFIIELITSIGLIINEERQI